MNHTLRATVHTLRSPLAAGMVAAVGAATLITAPAADSLRAGLATPSTAHVALTAWQNPILALLDSGEMGENYVFGGYYNGGTAPTPGAGEANWPFAGFAQAGGDVLNYLLTQKDELGKYFYVGFLENFAAEAYLPAVQQWQINVENDIGVVLSGLNLAARQLATGKFGEAGKTVIATGSYVVSNVVARATALIAVVPQILKTFAGSAIGGTTILVKKTAAIVKQVVASLAALNIEGAWNAAVNGFLGPSGLPGTLFNLNTGAGIQTGPIVNPATDIAGNFVPSVRTAVQAAQWTVRGALQAKPAPAAAAAGAPASARAVAAERKSTAVERHRRIPGGAPSANKDGNSDNKDGSRLRPPPAGSVAQPRRS